MTRFAYHVTIDAAPGQTDAVEEFLFWALPRIEEELGTKSWYALSAGNGRYEIFDTFDDEDARQTHLQGKVGDALRAKAAEGVIFARDPEIVELTILAEKIHK